MTSLPTTLPPTPAIAWHSNEFLNAAYSMGRDEKRIIWLCLSKARNLGGGAPTSLSADIYVAEYAEQFNLSSSTASADISAAINKLRTREIVFYLPEESVGDEIAYDAYNLLSRRASRPKRGVYQIELNPSLIQFFIGLKKEFTKLHLLDVAALKNPHAMRLYENLIQFESTKTFCQRIEWFIERYQLPVSYQHYGLFKKKFLDVSVAEINAKTPLSVGYVENKVGRKVTSILFSFSRKPKSAGATN
ncbi:MAG: RepB family plasmid replication initiator protein [Plesiomonas shigelloides]